MRCAQSPGLRRFASVIVATSVLALAGCGGDGGPTGPTVAVTIDDATFAPAEITVAAGGAVAWTSASKTERHTILPVQAGAFKAHTDLVKPGETVTITFAKAGDYAYYCSIHGTPTSGQRGVVHVTAPA